MAREEIAPIARQLLYAEVARRVGELIRKENLWGKYLAPERDLARTFGVGRQTLRRGLSVLEKQGTVSRRQGHGTLVLPRIRRIRRSQRARVLVGSFLQGEPGSYLGEILSGLMLGASDARCLLSYCDLGNPAKRQEFLRELADGGISGVMLQSFTDRALLDEILRVWHGPTVLVDHHFDGCAVTGIIDDGEDGARQATEHLIALGHRRIGYLEISRRADNPWRYAGYSGALRAGRLPLDENLVVPVPPLADAAREAAFRLLTAPSPPTAILAFDDVRAWGAWRAAESLGLVVGRDLAIVGYGDVSAHLGYPDDLSTVRVDWRALGQTAVATLADQIAGRAQAGGLIRIPARLVIRKSSREARPSAPPEGKEGRR